MEKNRSVVFRVLGSVLVLGAAGAVLFGLTGVLRDPSVVVATQAEQVAHAEPGPQAPAIATDGGSSQELEVVAKSTEEPFPQFDEEPTGS